MYGSGWETDVATLFPTVQEERPEQSPPDDLMERARQAADQELMALKKPPQQPNKQTLLTGHRRF